MPRRGVPMILKRRRDVAIKPSSPDEMSNVVRKVRALISLSWFTLDACRHGGMTELEEAELTTGRAAPYPR